MSRRRRLMSQINVVPYIDVTLVLLIIFMITAPLLTRGVKVNLPQAAAQALSEKEMERHQPVVLSVDPGGRLYLNIGAHPDAPLSPDMIVAMVTVVLRQTPDTPVLVRGDEAASYADVVRGMTLLQSAGAKNIGLITKTPSSPLVRKPGQP
ncbi:MAG TPA: ExbD/TolR family protein [Gammaproteobacteria bacterium]|nr:ExbD/TolR family protein [Gammaproteobacteria bacterium]